jgi:hypothetical protein
MKTFLESFSLGSGALLIAVLSMGTVWLLGSRLPKNLHSLSAVVVPFVLAYCLYCHPSGSVLTLMNIVLGQFLVSEHGFWQDSFRRQ